MSVSLSMRPTLVRHSAPGAPTDFSLIVGETKNKMYRIGMPVQIFSQPNPQGQSTLLSDPFSPQNVTSTPRLYTQA